MKKIAIEKYIDGKMFEHHNVPVMFVNLLDKLLPSSALTGMKDKGLDLGAVMEAAKTQSEYKSRFDVVENGIKTTIHVLLK